MKSFKISFLFLIIAAFGLVFSACEEIASTDDGPVITSISPTSGMPGINVTITGEAFGDYSQGTSFVYFGTVKAEIKAEDSELQWFEDEITVIVPDGISTGNVTVKVDGKTSNGVEFQVPVTIPPTGVMATSRDANSVALKWTLSQDENDADFAGYKLIITGGTGTIEPIDYPAGTNNALVGNLVEGTIYKFSIHAVKNIDGTLLLSSGATINWSPASRFIENINEAEIRMYGASSQFGSGLQFFNASGSAPKTLKVSSGEEWDIGLYTSGNTVMIGAAGAILSNYASFTGTAKTVEISMDYYEVNSLDDVYDSQALNDGHSFSETAIDLASINVSTAIVVVVRAKDAGSAEWKYAKVLFKYDSGFLMGSGNDVYVECEISYQSQANVPYAF